MYVRNILVVSLLTLVGGGLSLLLMFQHHGIEGATVVADRICSADETDGCDTVSQSRYSSVSGVSLATFGVWFYGSMLFLCALSLITQEQASKGLMTLLVVCFSGILVLNLALLGLQAFVIEAFCTMCLMTYVVNVLVLIFAKHWMPLVSSITRSFANQEVQRAFSVWLVGSFTFLGSLLIVDQVFALKGSVNVGSLIGSENTEGEVSEATSSAPMVPKQTTVPKENQKSALVVDGKESDRIPKSVPKDSEQAGQRNTELEVLRERIRELELTLDDPQRYQEYQMAKATADFEQEIKHDLALEGIPFKGPDNALVSVVEFSDFLCPYCRGLAEAFSNYLPQSGGKVAIYFKNYPLDQQCNPSLPRTIHDGACELALGGICAYEQGNFWAFHDRVFDRPPNNPTNEDVVTIATAAGLDGEAMRVCLSSDAAAERLSKQIDEANRLNVRSTPTVYINGKKLNQLAGFLQAIETELGSQ